MKKFTIVLVILFLFTSLSVNIVYAQKLKSVKMTDFKSAPPPPIADKSKQIPKLTSQLDMLYKLHLQNKDYKAYAHQIQLRLIDDRVVVTVLPSSGQTTDIIDDGMLLQYGVEIQAKAKHSLRIAIPIGQLENVARSVAGIGSIDRLRQPLPDAIISEGVGLMNADKWQAQGYEGAGAKVGVIDGGFYKLSDAQSNGDIPATYYSVDYTGSGMENSSDGEHGTAVTEAAYDIAPASDYFLYKIGDLTDIENAKDDAISQGVHVINHSMSWFNYSFYDGTGPVSDIVNDAAANGITWVNAAGNRAEEHYRSVFTPTVNNYHDFTGSSDTLNTLGPEPGYVWLFPIGYFIRGFLNWDDYPSTNQDYDLYLYKWNYSTSQWEVVASSTTRQTGSQEPTEGITYLNRETDGRYAFAVHKYSATTDVDFKLIGIYGLSYHIVENSIVDPACAEGVVAVAAISQNFYDSGPQEYFSSQGPSSDGRPKPEVAAPDSCDSYAYGAWQGTSQSSPYTAGICAIIKSRFPSYTSDDIKNYLYNNCTVDLGDPGRDNIYGYGKIVMPGFGEQITVTSPNGGENWEVGSVQDITWTSSGTSGNVDIDYSTDSGSNWTAVVTNETDDGSYSWTIPDAPSTNCLVRITDSDGTPSDQSDAVFTISPVPFITVTSPNGSEDWEVGTAQDITWNSACTSGNVKIDYSSDNGSSWNIVTSSTPDDGTYSWTIPDDPSTECLVKVTDTDGNPGDQSDAVFTISSSQPQEKAIVNLPNIEGANGETITVPITVTTDSLIGIAQFVVEYDTFSVKFVEAQVGPDAPGFSLNTNPDLPFEPTAPGTNENVLVQISGGGTNSFTGTDRNVVQIKFLVVDEVTGNTSPLVFDQEISHTYLATVNINDIVGNDITFNDGSVHIIANRFNISGTVSYDGSGRAVPDAILGLTHSEGTGNETTDSNGEYLFAGILAGSVELIPSKNGDLRDAITGSDALLVLQYLAFLATLDDDQQFAGDVTEDGSVTGSDAQAILRYLAFYTDNIGATGQWSFIPSDTSFTLEADAVADFKAYLKGDANLDWNEGADLSKTGASNTILKIGEVDAADAKIVSIPLSIEAAGETLNTFVFSLSYDDACLRYIGIDKTNLTNEFMLVANGDEKGKIHVAMAGVKGVAADGSILNLNFEVIDPAQSSRLEVTRAFINDLQVVNFENGRINHNGTKLTAIPDRFNLEQNYPNPFNPDTRIAFQLPVASFVVVKIYNVMGDEIGILVNEKKEAGCHQLTWDGKNSSGDEVPSGMYLISFQAGEFRMNRKMLKIQ